MATATTPRVLAVILDVDGTLLDTERATQDLLKDFLATYGKVPDVEKEERRLGQMHTESATSIIADYGLPLIVDEYSEAIFPLYMQRWPKAKALSGVNRLIRHLSQNGVPLALASNFIRRNMDRKISKQKDWNECFSVVLGGDQVPCGKPSPDIFLEAAKRLGVDPSSCLVIEDSPVEVQAAKASGAKVVAVPSLQSQWHWYSIADVILHSLLDFQSELWGLPPFEDCIEGALPIESLFSRAQIGDVVSDNLYLVTAGDGAYESIPDQISGIFVGWAKLGTHGVCKVVHVSFVDSSDKMKMDPLELLLLGYIKKLENTENISRALKITEEDERIARNALDLPPFSEHANSSRFT